MHGNAYTQSAIICTDSTAAVVLSGNYLPALFLPGTVISDPATISHGISANVSPDSLHGYLNSLKTFKNRNTGSDTLSPTTGIGAARNWVLSKFQEFSARNDNRLKPAFLQFDMSICGMDRHKDIFAVLPGTDTSDKSIVIIEGHIDSRCAGLCDTACPAHGMEDNGSGTALVLELARVMSKYCYSRTIVFLVTIGEEQGLYGAQAFATYAQTNGIKIRAVLNNDVIGGIICGHTSSPPGCPGYHDIDSTQVRLFSFGGFNSFHKQLARFIKLEYKEMVQPTAAVPMTVSVMTPEDRTGRGGDHIPFRNLNYTAVRFTSANEYGDANVTSGSYTDRQHTSSDSLGIDVDSDGIIDSYYVDFNYLARNAVINGNAACMAATGPRTPDFTLSTNGLDNLTINVTDPMGYGNYRVGVRTTTNDWDSVYTISTTTATIPVGHANYIVSVASVDANGIESLFSKELMANVTGTNDVSSQNRPIELLQNKPNPADEATLISVLVNDPINYRSACISIRDVNGKEIKRQAISLNRGINEIAYDHGYNMAGTYLYSLVVDGKVIETRRMTFSY